MLLLKGNVGGLDCYRCGLIFVSYDLLSTKGSFDMILL